MAPNNSAGDSIPRASRRCTRPAGRKPHGWKPNKASFPFKAQPLTLCAYTVNCADILDLTNPDVRSAVSIELKDLGCDWEHMISNRVTPPSWQLATRLLEDECAGIVVPSFAKGSTARDINVVFWNWSSTPPHQVRVIDDEDRLPKGGRPWL